MFVRADQHRRSVRRDNPVPARVPLSKGNHQLWIERLAEQLQRNPQLNFVTARVGALTTGAGAAAGGGFISVRRDLDLLGGETVVAVLFERGGVGVALKR